MNDQLANLAANGVAQAWAPPWRCPCSMRWCRPRWPGRRRPEAIAQRAWRSSMSPTASTWPTGRPRRSGSDFELPYILEPLEPSKDKLLVFSGLAQDKAGRNGDGAGDHARALSSFLTGQQARKTHGADIKVGVSVDQVAARKVGQQTTLSLARVGLRSRRAGRQLRLAAIAARTRRTSPGGPTPRRRPRRSIPSWSSSGCSRAAPPTQSRPSARSTTRAFSISCSRTPATCEARLGDQGSPQAGRVSDLGPRAGSAHQRRRPRASAISRCPTIRAPAGIPKDYAEHIRLMYDLMALAFQADLTRVATFVVANEGSNRAYPFIDVPEAITTCRTTAATRRSKRRFARSTTSTSRSWPTSSKSSRHFAKANGTLLDNSMVALRQRHRRRQRPQPRQPADPAGRSRRRHHHAPAATSATRKKRRSTTCSCRCSTAMESPSRCLGDSNGRAEQSRRTSVGDCPDFSMPWEKNGTAPLSAGVRHPLS